MTAVVVAVIVLVIGGDRGGPSPPSLRSPPSSSARRLPRLPPPRRSKQYDFFACPLHPSVLGMLNDDYCDCPDGSDEYSTSACSHLTVGRRVYDCGSSGGGGATTVRVFASRVDDGAVDCPDGSDER